MNMGFLHGQESCCGRWTLGSLFLKKKTFVLRDPTCSRCVRSCVQVALSACSSSSSSSILRLRSSAFAFQRASPLPPAVAEGGPAGDAAVTPAPLPVRCLFIAGSPLAPFAAPLPCFTLGGFVRSLAAACLTPERVKLSSLCGDPVGIGRYGYDQACG
jgi:hypothetical protein